MSPIIVAQESPAFVAGRARVFRALAITLSEPQSKMLQPLLLCLLSAGAPGPGVSAHMLAPTLQDPAVEAPEAEAPEAEAPVVEATAVSALDALIAEYTSAEKEFKVELRKLKGGKARSDHRKANHPVNAFAPRFEALANEGEGRALFWLLDKQRLRNVSKGKRAQERLDFYTRIINENTAQPWFADELTRVAGDRKLELEQRVNLLKRVSANADLPQNTRLTATFHTGDILMKSKDATQKALGKQILTDLAASHPDLAIGNRAKYIIEKPDLSIGAIAPEFTGKTIDGKSISLSDYRGQVVLIDFFGFW